MTREEFDPLFYKIQQHYGKKLSRDAIEQYWDALSIRTAASIERAFQRLAISHPASNGFPRIDQFNPPKLYVPQGPPPKTYLDKLERAHNKAIADISAMGLSI